jgi:hypothetical protein
LWAPKTPRSSSRIGVRSRRHSRHPQSNPCERRGRGRLRSHGLCVFVCVCVLMCLFVCDYLCCMYVHICAYGFMDSCRWMYFSTVLCLPACLSFRLSLVWTLVPCPSVYLSVCPSVCLSVCMSVCPPVYLSVCRFVGGLSRCLSVYLDLAVCLLFPFLSVCSY